MNVCYLAGLDLGQTTDPTALSIVRRQREPGLPTRYGVVHLQRWKKHTPYPEIVGDVAAQMADPKHRPQWQETDEMNRVHIRVAKAPPLVVDATGVGRPVVDQFMALALPGGTYPLTITSGSGPGRWEKWNRSGRPSALVPKKDLIGCLITLLGRGQLQIKDSLPDAETLKAEMINFRTKITAAANETFEHRVGAHDDLLLSLAIVCWVSENPPTDRRCYTTRGRAIGPGQMQAMERRGYR